MVILHETLLTPDVTVPLPTVDPVLVTLVLDDDPPATEQQVDTPYPPTLGAHRGIDLGPGHAREHEREPEAGLLDRVDATAYEACRTTSAGGPLPSDGACGLDQRLGRRQLQMHEPVARRNKVDEVQVSRRG